MSADAARLRCPACGANTEPGAQRCPYCQARLATVACPSCLALMFEGTAFCPSCGARRVRFEEPADAKCPGCRNVMTSVSLGETTLLECATCDGIWVDAETFERICSAREAQAAVLHHFKQDARPIERDVRYRPCVRCGAMMNRVNFAKVSGTVVDVCKKHGTFLDHGELQAVVRFIQGGGIERARQRQLEDLKEQEKRLREQEARLAQTRYGTNVKADATEFGFGALVDLFGRD